MIKIILMALVAMLALSGCKDTVKVNCPECVIKSVDGVKEFECSKCTIEAQMSEDFKIISLPDRPTLPDRPDKD